MDVLMFPLTDYETTLAYLKAMRIEYEEIPNDTLYTNAIVTSRAVNNVLTQDLTYVFTLQGSLHKLG